MNSKYLKTSTVLSLEEIKEKDDEISDIKLYRKFIENFGLTQTKEQLIQSLAELQKTLLNSDQTLEINKIKEIGRLIAKVDIFISILKIRITSEDEKDYTKIASSMRYESTSNITMKPIADYLRSTCYTMHSKIIQNELHNLRSLLDTYKKAKYTMLDYNPYLTKYWIQSRYQLHQEINNILETRVISV